MTGKIKLKKKKDYNTGDKVGEYQIYLNKDLIYVEDIYIEKDKKKNDNKNIFDKIKGIFS